MLRTVTYPCQKKKKKKKICWGYRPQTVIFLPGRSQLWESISSSTGQPGLLSPSCSVEAGWAPLWFRDTQRLWQSSCNSLPCCTARCQETHGRCTKLPHFGNQQPYALSLLQKGTADEKYFRVAVWIRHSIHSEQRQPSLRGVTAAKTHCGSNTPLPDKAAGPCYHHLTIKLVAPSLYPIWHYVSVPGEGWRRDGACKSCSTHR